MTIKAGRHLWERHPHVRTGDELTFGERAADAMRAGFGSWTFVIVFVIFLAGWMILNSALILGHSTYDRYPWILLNLMLSCLAALQGALILIAAKRADRVAAEANLHHYEQTDAIKSLQDEQMSILSQLDEIHRHVSAMTPDAGKFPPGEFTCASHG